MKPFEPFEHPKPFEPSISLYNTQRPFQETLLRIMAIYPIQPI